MFVGYSIGTSNYLERITLSDSTHIINMIDHLAIGVETQKIDIWCSLKKEFTRLIYMYP